MESVPAVGVAWVVVAAVGVTAEEVVSLTQVTAGEEQASLLRAAGLS